MSVLELVNWDYISFQELDTLIRVGGEQILDNKLSSQLTPLCMACRYNREDLVSILLHHEAHTNVKSGMLKKTPLHFACDHSDGNLGIVRKLIQAGADVNAVDEDGNTGMHLACTESNVPVVKLLLEHNADISIADVDGETALIRACYAKSIELIDILLQAGSDPNVSQGQALEIAVRATSVEALKLLIDGGGDIHLGAFMCHASEHDHIEMMKILHNYGADINKTNRLGMTPLQIACFSDQSSLTAVRLLLHWGADVDAYSNMKETALHYACNIQDLRKIRLLLAYGANVTARDSHQLSPLLMALKNPSHSLSGSWSDMGITIVRLLLAAGASLSVEQLDRLRSAINLLQSTGEKRRDLLHVLDTHACQPISLQDLCRVCIRKTVHPNIDDNVGDLPLPNQMIQYLRFLDVLDGYVKS